MYRFFSRTTCVNSLLLRCLLPYILLSSPFALRNACDCRMPLILCSPLVQLLPRRMRIKTARAEHERSQVSPESIARGLSRMQGSWVKILCNEAELPTAVPLAETHDQNTHSETSIWDHFRSPTCFDLGLDGGSSQAPPSAAISVKSVGRLQTGTKTQLWLSSIYQQRSCIQVCAIHATLLPPSPLFSSSQSHRPDSSCIALSFSSSRSLLLPLHRLSRSTDEVSRPW